MMSKNILGKTLFDYIVSNPPYMKVDGKKQNDLSSKSYSKTRDKIGFV